MAKNKQRRRKPRVRVTFRFTKQKSTLPSSCSSILPPNLPVSPLNQSSSSCSWSLTLPTIAKVVRPLVTAMFCWYCWCQNSVIQFSQIFQVIRNTVFTSHACLEELNRLRDRLEKLEAEFARLQSAIQEGTVIPSEKTSCQIVEGSQCQRAREADLGLVELASSHSQVLLPAVPPPPPPPPPPPLPPPPVPRCLSKIDGAKKQIPIINGLAQVLQAEGRGFLYGVDPSHIGSSSFPAAFMVEPGKSSLFQKGPLSRPYLVVPSSMAITTFKKFGWNHEALLKTEVPMQVTLKDLLNVKLKKTQSCLKIEKKRSPLQKRRALVTISDLQSISLKSKAPTPPNFATNSSSTPSSCLDFRKHLRRVSIKRSPGGTPLLHKENLETGTGLTPLMTQALRRKFRLAHPQSPSPSHLPRGSSFEEQS